MSKHAFPLTLLLSFLGCAAPQQAPAPPPPGASTVEAQLRQLQDSLAHLDNRLGHLETEVSAQSAENELTAMTIDSVLWSDGRTSKLFGPQPLLLCHVAEWRGYGKMLRFVRMSDPTFELQAEGHPPVKANMETGGMTNSDGSTRYVMLSVTGTLDPGVRYSLRPRNQNEKYRWSVANQVVVTESAHKDTGVPIEIKVSDPSR